MLYGFLLTLYLINWFFLVLIILMQKEKLGMGGLGGGAQIIFDGNGGQDFFQKITPGHLRTALLLTAKLQNYL